MTTTNTSAARAAGLTSLNQAEIVRLLAEGPETMTALAAKLGVSTAGVTGIADKLEKLELLERHRGRQDRRSVWLKLTPHGRQIAAGMLSTSAAAITA